MKTCPSCNSRIDEALVVCPNCGHDFAKGDASSGASKTMMGFPALSDILAAEPAEEQDANKHTLFGFPAQKAAKAPVLEEDSYPDDDGEATSLIPAAQLQREFELDSHAPAAVEAHEPRMTMAGIPVSDLNKAPANIKGAWGLDEESENESTSIVPASAMFGNEATAQAGYSKRVESTEFLNSGTLMGMSLEDFDPTKVRPTESEDEAEVRSTQFAIPAVQVGAVASETAKTKPEEDVEIDDRDSGPVSGELPTQMWNPADELAGDESDDRRALLEKIRGDAAEQGSTRMGLPSIKADRGTAENPRAIVAPTSPPKVGAAPSIPKPNLGDTSSLRSRLQERLKGAIPPPATITKPAAGADDTKVMAELPEVTIEAIEAPETKPMRQMPQPEPRTLSKSGVLGGGTYVVSKPDAGDEPEPQAIGRIERKPIVPEKTQPASVAADTRPDVGSLHDDDDDFAYADTGIAPSHALEAASKAEPAPVSKNEETAPRPAGRVSREETAPIQRDRLGSKFPTGSPTSDPSPSAPLPSPPQPVALSPAPMSAPIPTTESAPILSVAPAEPTPIYPGVQHPAPQPEPTQTAGISRVEIPSAPTPAQPSAGVENGNESLISLTQRMFGGFACLLLLSAAVMGFIGTGGMILSGALGVLALAVAVVTAVPLPLVARTIGWLLLGFIVALIAAAVLTLEQISPMAGALAIGGGLAALFAGFSGIILKVILK